MDKTANAVSVFDELAALYQEKFMDVSDYGDSLRFFCDNLPNDASLLELACGPGNITRFLLDYRPELKIFATDLSPNMIALAKANNPQASFGLLDCRDVKKTAGRYDGIICGFGLPYLAKADALRLIADSRAVLNKNGLFYLSAMEDDYARSRLVSGSTGHQIFMHYHEAGYLKEAFKSNGFEIVYEQRRHSKNGQDAITDLMLIARRINS